MNEMTQSLYKQRLRLTFAKKSDIKYISHLDLALLWERALRRARLPLGYSQGFNPRPKIQIASGLPLGTSGTAEILDMLLTEPVNPDEALERIRPTLPLGVALYSVEEVPLKAAALQQLLHRADYRVLVETDLPAETLRQRINDLLAAEQIIQTRRRRKQEETYDLRPWLYELRLAGLAEGVAHLHMQLAAGQSGNLRPQEVLKVLGLADNWVDLERTRLIFDNEASN
ncbi:MAG TPA: TIGR03936 family radical SAM-associated protein [Anaerolineae bacterium]